MRKANNMRKSLIALLCFTLLGCANPLTLPGLSTDDDELHQPKESIEIDSRLLEECADLTDMDNSNPSPKDVLEQRAKDVSDYAKCKRNHSSLIKIVRKAFNL